MNSAGLVTVLASQFEVLVIMAGLVVLAAAIIAVATVGRPGLQRPGSDDGLAGEGRPLGRSSSQLVGRQLRPASTDGASGSQSFRALALGQRRISDRDRGSLRLAYSGCCTPSDVPLRGSDLVQGQ